MNKIPNEAFFQLAKEHLKNDQIIEFIVMGNSMLPFFKNGLTVVKIKQDTDYKKYDVILFIYNGKYVLHRIIKVKKDLFIVKGDGALNSEKISRDKILGKVIDFHTSGKRTNLLNFKVRFWLLLSPFRKLLLKIIKK